MTAPMRFNTDIMTRQTIACLNAVMTMWCFKISFTGEATKSHQTYSVTYSSIMCSMTEALYGVCHVLLK